MRKRRKGEPLKSNGGRPALRLYNDPDRWIVIMELWLKDDPREQRSHGRLYDRLEAFDLLLSPHNDGIEARIRDPHGGRRRVRPDRHNQYATAPQ